MTNSRPLEAPPVLLELVVFCALLIYHSRWPFNIEGPPVFLSAERDDPLLCSALGLPTPGSINFLTVSPL